MEIDFEKIDDAVLGLFVPQPDGLRMFSITWTAFCRATRMSLPAVLVEC